MKGENFRKGLEKSRRSAKKRVASKRKGRQKNFWGMRQKFRGAANPRSVPGGRHPSYVTVCNIHVYRIHIKS